MAIFNSYVKLPEGMSKNVRETSHQPAIIRPISVPVDETNSRGECTWGQRCLNYSLLIVYNVDMW